MRIGILVDDQLLRDLLVSTFQLHGDEVSAYPGVEELFAHLCHEQPSASSAPWDVLVLSQYLAGACVGITVLRRLRSDVADFPAVVLSSAPSATLGAATEGLSGVRLLAMPFTLSALLRAVKSMKPVHEPQHNTHETPQAASVAGGGGSCGSW